MRKGFTLIELLVVIAIIGLLSSIVLASLNSARVKARDARRKADLAEISKALELYYDVNGSYLVSGYGSQGQGWFNLDGSPNTVAKGLNVAGFLSAASLDDPLQKQQPGYMIYLCNNNQKYAISATLENPSDADIAYIQTTCNGTGGNGTYTRYGKNYAVGN